MSTSFATRLLWSTWVALTTMQRKWRVNRPPIFLLQRPQANQYEKQERETAWNNMNIEPFPGARFKDEFTPTRTKSNNTNSNKKSVSDSTHTHQELPWEAGGCGDYPCVIHILTSVFQCEGRIIHVCCGQLSPIWTSEIQMASEQELWYYTCIKYKKIKKKIKKTQRAWIFAAP